MWKPKCMWPWGGKVPLGGPKNGAARVKVNASGCCWEGHENDAGGWSISLAFLGIVREFAKCYPNASGCVPHKNFNPPLP
jgi:hypothetical protein